MSAKPHLGGLENLYFGLFGSEIKTPFDNEQALVGDLLIHAGGANPQSTPLSLLLELAPDNGAFPTFHENSWVSRVGQKA